MPFPAWMLLGFAIWTVAVLLFTVGIYRWSRILTGRVAMKDFRGDKVEGDDFYLRAMRAHANCIENLQVFGAVVLVLYIGNVSSPAIDIMAGIVLVARVLQTTVHVALVQTNGIALIRFIFFFAQLFCFVGMAAAIVHRFL
jgi:uncharacterized MAPEG superfamily protein